MWEPILYFVEKQGRIIYEDLGKTWDDGLYESEFKVFLACK